MPKSTSPRGSGLTLVFAVFMLLVGGYRGIEAVHMIRAQRDLLASSKAVTATIDKVWLQKIYLAKRWKYRPRVAFHYQFDGKRVDSATQRLYAYERISGNEAWATEMIAAYSPGADVEAFADKTSPERSFLIMSVDFQAYGMALMCLVLASLSLVHLAKAWRLLLVPFCLAGMWGLASLVAYLHFSTVSVLASGVLSSWAKTSTLVLMGLGVGSCIAWGLFLARSRPSFDRM